MDRLTGKQESFCQILIEVGSASRAYREVYARSPSTQARTCSQNAYLLK